MGHEKASKPRGLTPLFSFPNAAGEFLETNAWENAAVIWEDMPAYDEATLVADYSTSEERSAKDSAFLTVTFQVLGNLISREGGFHEFQPAPAIQTCRYIAAVKLGRWYVTNPQMNQHVLPEAVRRRGTIRPSDQRLIDSVAANKPAVVGRRPCPSD